VLDGGPDPHEKVRRYASAQATLLHGDPAPPPKMDTAPKFRPVYTVAKRSPISATAEHLSLFSAAEYR